MEPDINPRLSSVRVAVATLRTEQSPTALQKLSIAANHLMRKVLARAIYAWKDGVSNDLHSNEAFFWMALYNAALLESDPAQLPVKIQLALRAVEARRTVLEKTTSAREWNLLQYAAIVLRRVATNAHYERPKTLWTKEAA